MAITTEDGIVAGLLPPQMFFKAAATAKQAGTLHAIMLQSSGFPAAFASASPGLNGANVDGTTSTLGGTLAYANPGANGYLAKVATAIGANMQAAQIADLLWYNSGLVVTTTTAQSITQPTLPARDNSGTTNGAGVIAYLYCSVATTNASAIANTTISYTNQAGTSGRTGTLVQSWPATAVAGTLIPFSLQAGDTGVRSIQSCTLGTSYVTGTVLLMCLREVAFVPFVAASSGGTLDWSQLGFPQLWNGTALTINVLPTGTALGAIIGETNFAQG